MLHLPSTIPTAEVFIEGIPITEHFNKMEQENMEQFNKLEQERIEMIITNNVKQLFKIEQENVELKNQKKTLILYLQYYKYL